MPQFRWKDGARQRLDPQVVGERIDALREQHGAVSARVLLDDATPVDAPLHDGFTWDDSAAADQFRLVEARLMIRSVVMLPSPALGETAPKEIRAFLAIGDIGAQSYQNTYVVMGDAYLRQQVLQRAMRELRQWRERYRDLEELAGIFEAIDSNQAA